MNCRLCSWRIVLSLVVFSQIGASLQALPFLPAIPKGTITIGLNPVATGMGAPDYGISPPGDTSRMFVVEQKGTLRILQNGSLLAGSALDIQSRVQASPGGTGPLIVTSANEERGFLGLAFHPGFSDPASPGYRTLYTYTSEALGAGATYAAPNGALQNYKNLITEWKMSAANPNVVDPTSRREIISFGKNASNHNGGTITFGPDGLLYLGLGDGGNANDSGASHNATIGNGQDLATPLGKLIRIDPLNPALTPASPNAISGNGQYRIPTTNPFQAAGQAKEIFAYGFRNPYRFAFDGATGELIVADVGQNSIEEIDRVQLGGNYGWPVKEGTFTFNRTTGNVITNSPGAPAGLIDPITGTLGTLEYDHGDGISITGGFIYRGTALPALVGKYVFGDLAITQNPFRQDGRLFYADLQTGVINEFLIPQFVNDKLPNDLTVHGFGQDGNGELYALVTNTASGGAGGIIYKLVAVPEPATLALLIVAVGWGSIATRSRQTC